MQNLGQTGTYAQISDFQMPQNLQTSQLGMGYPNSMMQDQILRRDQLLQKAKATINILMQENDKLTLENRQLKQGASILNQSGLGAGIGNTAVIQKDQQISALNLQITELTAQNLELNHEIAKLRSTTTANPFAQNPAMLKQVVTNNEIEYQQQIIHLNSQINELTATSEALKAQMAEKDQELSQLRLKAGTIESTLSQIKQELNIAQQKLTYKEQEVADLTSKLASAQMHSEELYQHNLTLKGQQGDSETKTTELQQILIEKNLLIQKLEKDVTILNSDLEYHKNINVDIKNQIQTLNSQLHQAQSGYKHKCDIEQNLQQQINQLQQDKQISEKKFNEIQTQFDSIVLKYNQLNQDYQIERNKNERSRDIYQKHTEESSVLSQTIDKLNNHINEQNKQFQKQAEQVMKLSLDNQKLNEQVLASQSQLKDAQAELQRVSGENVAYKTSIQDFNRLNDEFNKKLTDQNTELQTLIDENKKLKSENSVISKQLEQMSGNFNKINIEYQDQIGAKNNSVRLSHHITSQVIQLLKNSFKQMLESNVKLSMLQNEDLFMEQFSMELNKIINLKLEDITNQNSPENLTVKVQELFQRQADTLLTGIAKRAEEITSNQLSCEQLTQENTRLLGDVQRLNQTIQYMQEATAQSASETSNLQLQIHQYQQKLAVKEDDVKSLKIQLKQQKQHQESVKAFVEDCKIKVQQYEQSAGQFQQFVKQKEEQNNMQLQQQQQVYREKIGTFCSTVLAQLKTGTVDKDALLRLVVQLSKDM